MKIIVIFIILSVINVVFSTARSLVTINGGKGIAAIMNAAYFAYYNVVLIYTVADFPLWVKCLVTFGANLIGVYVVKLVEEKRQPVKMWKLEVTIPTTDTALQEYCKDLFLLDHGIACNYIQVGKWTIYNCYCDTKEQVKFLKEFCQTHDGKMSAYESAPL